MGFSLSKSIGKVCKSVAKSVKHVTKAVSSIARSGLNMVGSIFGGCCPRYNVAGCAIGNVLCGSGAAYYGGGCCGGPRPFGPRGRFHRPFGHRFGFRRPFGPRFGFRRPFGPRFACGPRPHARRFW